MNTRIFTTSPNPAANVRRPPPWRRSAGSDSGTQTIAVTIIASPNPTSTQNTVRHVPPKVRTAPPTTGAIIGAKPPSAIMIDIIRANTSPRATSTRTARATTAATPPPKPCSTRKAISQPIVGAMAQPSAPRVHSRPPAIIGSRRPR